MEGIIHTILENGNLEVTIPIALCSRQGRKQIITPDGAESSRSLLAALARGRRWQRLIDEGRFVNIKELATAIGKAPSQIARAIRLTRLSPVIVHSVVVGDIPDGLSLAKLRGDLPVKWSEQEEMLMGKDS